MLVAQVAELEFRKKLMDGDDKLVQSLWLGTWATVGELIKVFGKIPPFSLLHICNPQFGK